MDTSSLLREAIAAVKAGQRQYARELLLEVVELEPTNEFAWIWLSGLLETRTEQIKALENSLAIDKGGPHLEDRLHVVGKQEVSTELAKFRAAIRAVESGNRGRGRKLLQEVVKENSEHERAWMLLSDLYQDDEKRVFALNNVLRISPNNFKAREKLLSIQHRLYQTFLSQGHSYQRRGESKKAIEAYQAAEKHASTGSFRAAARQRWELIQEQSGIRPMRVADPTMTLLRLALGPSFFFFLLVLLQSGFDPSEIPGRFYLGLLIVIVGSVITAVTYVPEHSIWSALGLGLDRSARGRLILARAAGIALILLPFVLWIIEGVRRLQEAWGLF